jgi:hypothetical protein
MEPVARSLIKNPLFDVYFSTSYNTEIEERELTINIFKKNNWKYILGQNEMERENLIYNMNFDVFICGWSRYPIEKYCNPTTLCCMIYHGIGIKPTYYRDHNQRIDMRFIEGSFRKKQLRDYGVETDLELVGFAKLDPLFNGDIGSQTEVLEQLGLDPSRKTILYAPTFYPSSFEVFKLKLPEMTKDYNLIIKLHQWIYFRSNFGGINLKKQQRLIAKIRKLFPEVKIIEPKDYSIVSLYQAADILLTEASSTIYEMMALQKHVIICDFYKKKLSHKISEKRMFKRRLDRGMKSDLYDFCYHINSPGELPEALDKCFNKPDPFIDIRNKYIDKMLYKLDGKASDRIVDTLLKRLTK